MVLGFDARTALLVVDVQNDFADPRGSLPVPGGDQLLPVVNQAIGRARAAGALVVYTQDWHPESTPHFEKDGGVWPVHCVRRSWGAELHPRLDVAGGAEVVRKGSQGEDGYSAFSMRDPTTGEVEGTLLDRLLAAGGIERVVIVGLATDYCVKETALDAVAKGFHTTVLLEAIRAVDLEPGDGDRALEAMRAAGARLE